MPSPRDRGCQERVTPFFVVTAEKPQQCYRHAGSAAFGLMKSLRCAILSAEAIMSIERVRAHLARYGADGRILEFPVSSATVELAAKALGCEPCRIAKTLAFGVGGTTVLIVCAGDVKIDNRKFKDFFHTKAAMLPRELTAELTGHAVGGVCPFAVNDGVKIFLDESLKRFATVFPACGSANSAIELTLPELERFSGSTSWIDVTKPYQE